MAFQPDNDDLSAFEAKDTSHRLPVGWTLLFWGLIGWGLYYVWAYTPGLGGWQQAQDVEGGGATLGSNVLATVLFTVIPAAVAVTLMLVQRRKKAH